VHAIRLFGRRTAALTKLDNTYCVDLDEGVLKSRVRYCRHCGRARNRHPWSYRMNVGAILGGEIDELVSPTCCVISLLVQRGDSSGAIKV